MAQFQIITNEAPYYTVKVTFADQAFTQQLVSVKTDQALTDQFQEYADAYEAAWVPPVAAEPEPEPEAAPEDPAPDEAEGPPES